MYWIFRRPDHSCLAVEEEALAESGIDEDLGELIYDEPMPLITAQMHVAAMGGGIIDPVPHIPKPASTRTQRSPSRSWALRLKQVLSKAS